MDPHCFVFLFFGFLVARSGIFRSVGCLVFLNWFCSVGDLAWVFHSMRWPPPKKKWFVGSGFQTCVCTVCACSTKSRQGGFDDARRSSRPHAIIATCSNFFFAALNSPRKPALFLLRLHIFAIIMCMFTHSCVVFSCRVMYVGASVP